MYRFLRFCYYVWMACRWNWKGNRSLNRENVVDWIWFNFTLKIGIQTCYECQPQNDFAVSKLWLDRHYNVKLKFFGLILLPRQRPLKILVTCLKSATTKTHNSSNKFEGTVHLTEVMGEFVQFWLLNVKFRCHGDLHCKFEPHIWNHRLEASCRYKNIENAVHMTEVFTKFM